MATSAPLPSSATRTEIQLVKIISSWRRQGSSGEAFAAGLSDWLRLSHSTNTRSTYSFSVLEFFDWYDIQHRYLPLPDRYERKVAIDYADYLRSRSEGLDEQRLARDGRLALELSAYRAIKRAPGISGEAVRQVLEREHPSTVRQKDREAPGWYEQFLGCLVTRKLADRSPTYFELQTRYKREEPPPFSYRPHVHTDARGIERASTIATRLSALSALWRYYIERSGENTGRRPLLSYDIWSPVLEQFSDSAIAQKKATRELTSMSLDTFKVLVASTATGDPSSLQNLRDRALLLFMFYTAVRVDEVVSLRRSSVTGDSPNSIVTVVGKGQKMRQFRLPEPVIGHLEAFSAALVRETARAKERGLTERADRLARLGHDDAPLFPALARRGCAASEDGTDSLGTSGLSMMLRRRALASGLSRPDLLRTVHPHAIRHLAARTAVDYGTPITRVQAVMGHEHVSTTGMYAEEHDPRAIALFQKPRYEPRAEPAPPPRARPPEVIDVDLEEIRIPELPPVKMPPPEPVSRQIVELGGKERIAHEIALGIAPGEHDVMARLDTLYTSATWGEDKDRSQLHRQKEKLPGFDTDEDRLTTAYVGKWSHLVWWAGSSNKLRPEMPVMSVRQAFEKKARFLPGEESLQDALAGLYDRWYESADDARGPTSAAALVMWVKEALVTMDQVELDREEKGLRWVAFDAPFEKGERFREHREDKIVTWFEARAGIWTTTPGESGSKGARVPKTEDVPRVPDFYRESDPLGAVPEPERTEYFDWLAAMTGKAPPSSEKRFLSAPGDLAPTLTRKDLASVLALFCAYDQGEDDLGDDPAEMKRALKTVSDAIAQTVAKLSRNRTRFDYAKRVAERKKATRAGGRAGNRFFYMKILGELFGEEAAEDAVLALYTACGGEPLAGETVPGGTYAEFFRVVGDTIVHTEKFREAFAKATGAHSECVARRVARSLYELRQADARLVDPTRSSELEAQLAAWTAFKVPCPAALEGELKARLGRAGADPARLREPFARHEQVGRLAADKELEAELEGRGEGAHDVFERRGLAEGGGFHAEGPSKQRSSADYWRPNRRRFCPSVVHLTFWVYEERRVRRMLVTRLRH